ncbi:toxin-activating lysine-acyltransferase [Cribrihabitans sp. XS_ASV171]
MSRLVDSEGRPLPDVEVPSPEKLRIYGDMSFLAFRSSRHSRMSVGQLRTYLEPAIEFGQFRVFRFDDVPRAMITWAYMGPDSIRKLIEGAPLEPADWRSGPDLWVIDLIAPYRRLTGQLVRWMMVRGNFAAREFWFRRVGDANETRRIVHIDFEAEKLSRVYSADEFIQTLD